MVTERKTKNVTVTNATYDRLEKLGKKGDSFEQIIARLLDEHEKSEQT